MQDPIIFADNIIQRSEQNLEGRLVWKETNWNALIVYDTNPIFINSHIHQKYQTCYGINVKLLTAKSPLPISKNIKIKVLFNPSLSPY